MISKSGPMSEEDFKGVARLLANAGYLAHSNVEDNSATKDGAAVKQNVPRTVVRQIAQECARAISDGEYAVVRCYIGGDGMPKSVKVDMDDVCERLKQTLDAISETRWEEWNPTS